MIVSYMEVNMTLEYIIFNDIQVTMFFFRKIRKKSLISTNMSKPVINYLTSRVRLLVSHLIDKLAAHPFENS